MVSFYHFCAFVESVGRFGNFFLHRWSIVSSVSKLVLSATTFQIEVSLKIETGKEIKICTEYRSASKQVAYQ